MHGLLFYGANCTAAIWEPLMDSLPEYEFTLAEYPHEVTRNAHGVADITKWVAETYPHAGFDFMIGHSMGGIIAVELAANYDWNCEKIILIETNLKPAAAFYRNLMLPKNLDRLGASILPMLKGEAPFYSPELKQTLQEDFDYTGYVRKINLPVYVIYGDRGQPEYVNKISDLCLDAATLAGLEISFVNDACHLPMVENPAALAQELTRILSNPGSDSEPR